MPAKQSPLAHAAANWRAAEAALWSAVTDGDSAAALAAWDAALHAYTTAATDAVVSITSKSRSPGSVADGGDIDALKQEVLTFLDGQSGTRYQTARDFYRALGQAVAGHRRRALGAADRLAPARAAVMTKEVADQLAPERIEAVGTEVFDAMSLTRQAKVIGCNRETWKKTDAYKRVLKRKGKMTRPKGAVCKTGPSQSAVECVGDAGRTSPRPPSSSTSRTTAPALVTCWIRSLSARRRSLPG